MSPPHRFAIYFAPPPDHALSRAASWWLGRDAHSGCLVDDAASAGFPDDVRREITAFPRRYGFHATLKAPFRLENGHTEDELLAFARRFAQSSAPVTVPLKIRRLGRFFALVPAAPSPLLGALAASVVVDFDPFRAPLTGEDIARRDVASLADKQADYLDRWGYPYVLDEFRFHMTLTGPIEDRDAEAVRAELERRFFPAITDALVIDALTVFIEETPGGPFTVKARFPFPS